MVFPTKNITNIPYIASYATPATATAAALLVTVNAVAKTCNVCTGSGTLTFHAIPGVIASLLPANTCRDNFILAAASLAVTGVLGYVTFKKLPKTENAPVIETAPAPAPARPKVSTRQQHEAAPSIHAMNLRSNKAA